MRLLEDDYIGQLIEDPTYKSEWIELVRALDIVTKPGAPLHGWVFHGTDDEASWPIRQLGLYPSFAIVLDGDDWVETEAVHFGSPMVAAFFAEDLIEKKERQLELVIFGAPLANLKECGEFATDAQMIDCPLYTRLKLSQDEVDGALESPKIGWEQCLAVLETVVVRGIVPPKKLTEFRSTSDLRKLLDNQFGNDREMIAGVDFDLGEKAIQRKKPG